MIKYNYLKLLYNFDYKLVVIETYI